MLLVFQKIIFRFFSVIVAITCCGNLVLFGVWYLFQLIDSATLDSSSVDDASSSFGRDLRIFFMILVKRLLM